MYLDADISGHLYIEFLLKTNNNNQITEKKKQTKNY
jgi:hypothetical protein